MPDHVTEVNVIVQGEERSFVLSRSAWPPWFDAKGPSPDFMMQREQPLDDEVRREPSARSGDG